MKRLRRNQLRFASYTTKDKISDSNSLLGKKEEQGQEEDNDNCFTDSLGLVGLCGR